MAKKGYWIGRVDVHDAENYKGYMAANAEPLRKYGAKFLVRGGPFEAKEGSSRSRNVVIEFPMDFTLLWIPATLAAAADRARDDLEDWAAARGRRDLHGPRCARHRHFGILHRHRGGARA